MNLTVVCGSCRALVDSGDPERVGIRTIAHMRWLCPAGPTNERKPFNFEPRWRLLRQNGVEDVLIEVLWADDTYGEPLNLGAFSFEPHEPGEDLVVA